MREVLPFFVLSLKTANLVWYVIHMRDDKNTTLRISLNLKLVQDRDLTFNHTESYAIISSDTLPPETLVTVQQID